MQSVDNKSIQGGYISLVAVLSAFAVVCLHCNAWHVWSRPSGRLWISANIIDTFFTPAVPLFLMLTGITLMDYRKRYSTCDFFLKRIRKTFIPFVFWSMIAWGYCVVVKDVDCFSPLYILKGILNSDFMGIYWFFPALFAIYLSIPVLSLLPDKMKVFPYMIGYAFLTIFVGNVLNASGEKWIPSELMSPISAGLLIYPLLGYVLYHSEQTKCLRLCIYLLGGIGFCCSFRGNDFLLPGECSDNGSQMV